MSKIGSSQPGKSNSQSVNNSGAGTVAGNVRDGAEKAVNSTMKTGVSGGASQGTHGGFMKPAGSNDYQFVAAGTQGGPNAKTGANGTVTASKATVPGRAPATTEVARDMKQGKGPGASTGTHKGYM